LYLIFDVRLPAGEFADEPDSLHRFWVNQPTLTAWTKAVIFCLGKTDSAKNR
jgi:hypothetical protein